MPVFEYKCGKCGHAMEFLEKTRRAHKHVCERCGSLDLQKLFSSFAVGQSKSPPSPACDVCPSGPCSADTCSTDTCPLS
ncbi:MAG: hypothetical protein JSU70_11375 [Phycisphaerales bacterium]|nr:MAG: hypothetical protein JSU70_11375 [Phycisphaerales bacterium]